MPSAAPGADLVFVWHHHQPDYRDPRDGRALLPWVRLHATKDYLDMALHLERHPLVHATFNFAPSLLDQLDDAIRGAPDALFDLLRAAPASLSAEQRVTLQRRTRAAPRWARERWPAYALLCERLRAPAAASDDELVRLACFFLLAWTDPLLLDAEPVAREAAAAAVAGTADIATRDALLALHAELWRRVVPAYAALAARGQVELTCSPAFHPILPLLIDVTHARRARADLPSPSEPFTAPEDARWQIERGRERMGRAFGQKPAGMWPSEGSVSPEAAELFAAAGVRWVATDEAVLWQSLPEAQRRREALYRPWLLPTASGELAIFFRDHELSDRIGFVYSTWTPAEAAADFVARVRRIGATHPAAAAGERPVISVILDGENCWEHYAEDGRPFLEALYTALEAASDIRTRTPSEVLASGATPGRLERLHSGSWIDGDFHIWAGHPEKNRAWDLLARTRRALVESGATRESHPAAWESLGAAEGSDWFWWFGDDNFTADKPLFDSLFRAHLQAVYEKSGLPAPSWLAIPISSPASGPAHHDPTALIRPLIDGRVSQFYEWNGAGKWALTGGGSMHRVTEALAETLHFGFDDRTLYLRLDFPGLVSPGPDVSVAIEILAPNPRRIIVPALKVGIWDLADAAGVPVKGAKAALVDMLEVAIPFAALGATQGQTLELMLHLERGHERLESLPPGQTLRLTVPGPEFDAAHWSA